MDALDTNSTTSDFNPTQVTNVSGVVSIDQDFVEIIEKWVSPGAVQHVKQALIDLELTSIELVKSACFELDAVCVNNIVDVLKEIYQGNSEYPHFIVASEIVKLKHVRGRKRLVIPVKTVPEKLSKEIDPIHETETVSTQILEENLSQVEADPSGMEPGMKEETKGRPGPYVKREIYMKEKTPGVGKRGSRGTK